jgi:aminopeptidase N
VVDHFERHRFGNATMQDLFASWEEAGAGDLSGFTGDWLRTAGPDALLLDRGAGAVRRTPPAGSDARRRHTFRAAIAAPGSGWRIETLVLAGSSVPLSVAPTEAVVLDPWEDTWALVQPDGTTVPLLAALLPGTPDAHLRAGVWNNVRTAFHNAAIDPADVLTILEAGLPAEDNDDALAFTLPWAIRKVAVLSAEPLASLDRIHATCRARLQTAVPGSTVQLAAFRGAIDSCTDADQLFRWRDGTDLPPGLVLDLDLRWHVLVHLAAMGRTDPEELQRHLDAEPTNRSQVEYARARASLPAREAKAWAWQRFTGEVEATNYELEAIGHGLWRTGQELLTKEYVAQYFAELPAAPRVHSGWVLGDVTKAFFPMTSLTAETVARADAVIAADGLDLTIRRNLVDMTDELRRRIAVRTRYGG